VIGRPRSTLQDRLRSFLKSGGAVRITDEKVKTDQKTDRRIFIRCCLGSEVWGKRKRHGVTQEEDPPKTNLK